MALTIFNFLVILTASILFIRALHGFLVGALGINLKAVGEILKNLRPFLKSAFRLALIALLVVFIGGSIVPYMLNQSDAAYIKFANSNIELYNGYIDEYTQAARKQIEEYQRLQSEMARSATSTQLQFWSQQQDEVGNALTDKIQEFKSYIMDEEVEINKRDARIEQRSTNKWFFWHEL